MKPIAGENRTSKYLLRKPKFDEVFSLIFDYRCQVCDDIVDGET
jgi:hypothetical protein